MHELLNVLYVQTQGAVLHLEYDTVRVSVEGQTKLRVPLLRLGGIVAFGQVTITLSLFNAVRRTGETLWLTRTGAVRYTSGGAVTRGNVLLRHAQHCFVGCVTACSHSAPDRGVKTPEEQALMRAARDTTNEEEKGALSTAASRMAYLTAAARA